MGLAGLVSPSFCRGAFSLSDHSSSRHYTHIKLTIETMADELQKTELAAAAAAAEVPQVSVHHDNINDAIGTTPQKDIVMSEAPVEQVAVCFVNPAKLSALCYCCRS